MPERIVFIHLPGETEAVPAGRLTMIEQGLQVQASRFAYGRHYLQRANAVPVDPVALQLAEGRGGAELVPPAGLALFGALRDATPDAWGRRVIENRLKAPPNGLPESTYLEHAGPHRAGALDIRPTPTSMPAAGALPSVMDLGHLLALHEQDSPDASYAAIADALGQHGVGGSIAPDRGELYARMVFNILVTNDDDHLRNHAFLYNAKAPGWRLSPLYDVVPKPQAGQERMLHLAVGPQGRAARLDNALAGAGRFGLLPPDAAKIIDRVVDAVRGWRNTFERLGVTARDCDQVASAFRRAGDIGMRAVEKHLH